ncbi:MAG: menaquinone biosynthesis protein [Bacteroidetes bacterium]|nr:menaquinone biosynthesis protein [Bacteroidota bacterium]
MVRISAVSYLNTKPFLHGLKLAALKNVELSVDIPSECARKLLEGEVDLGLIPVAVIPSMKEAHLIPGFCIAGDGEVDSVKLYSDVPLEKIKTVLLDYQSKTSVLLTKILAGEFWKINPEWKNAQSGYEKQIAGTQAGVVIGDRTFEMNGKYQHEYDLSAQWKKMTGLPFVFACWVSNKILPEEFILQLSSAFERGLNDMGTVIESEKKNFPFFDVEKYLGSTLRLRMDERAFSGMQLFLEKVSNHRP